MLIPAQMKRDRFLSIPAIICAFLGFIYPALAEPLAFSSANFPSGSGPALLLAVDINGDGHPGLVAANFGFRYGGAFGLGGGSGSTLSVFTNDGYGDLSPGPTLTVGSEPAGIAAADVNGDGLVDLICANVGDNTLTVLTNDGNGGFALEGTFSVGQAPVSVAAADVNGDGKVDLISANYGGSTLTVLTNDGHGGFALSATITVGSAPNCVAAADINGDGKVDLVCANSGDGTLLVLTNSGKGVFTASATINVAGGGPSWVVATDVDRDGTVDLIVAGGGSTLTVLTNDGRGNFSLKSTVSVADSAGMVAAADMNGDGKVDLICPNNGNEIRGFATVLTNDGQGIFTVNTVVPVGIADWQSIGGNYPNSVAAADFNGDGNMDFAVACYGTATLTELTQINVRPRPIVTITNPANDALLPATNSFVINTTATSSNKIEVMIYYLGTNLLGASTNAPFDLHVRAGSIPMGSYALQAEAFDSAGHIGWSPEVLINVTSASAVVPPVVGISSPGNGLSVATTNGFVFAAGASSVYGVAGLGLYENGSNVASVEGSNVSLTVSNLAAGSYALTAVATDSRGLSATSAVVHVTVNTPGTTLIDFEAVDASAGPVSGAELSNYLAGYGVTVSQVSSNTAVAVQADSNLLGGTVTVASSGDNLLTQTGANGAVAYTLLFNRPYLGVSWTRTELLAGTGGVETPGWRATAYDSNGAAVGSVGEQQRGSFTNVPARRFTLTGPDIASVTFAGDNSVGALATLPLDDLLLSSIAPGTALTVGLSAAGSELTAPGQIQLSASASESGGTVVEIDFYEGSSLVGSVVAGPVAAGPPSSLTNASLVLSNVAAGAYSFTAVATDSQGGVRSSAAVPVSVAGAAGVSVINFDVLDTSAGAVGGAALSNYLAGFGVSAANVTLGTRLEAVNQNNLSSGAGAVPSSPPNLFTQAGLNQPVTFTLELGAAVGSVSFTRVGLVAGPGGVSHPAWRAHALDAGGAEVESAGEALFLSASNVPARIFQLTGGGIRRVRFDSDSEGVASFSAVLLDDLVLESNTAPGGLAVSLMAAATNGWRAPADIPLSASVSDSLGTVVQSVAFYAGPNLIGTATSEPFAMIWSNVLAGTNVLTAEAFDSAGYARVSSPVTVSVSLGTGNSKLADFDALNASRGPVTGTALSNYLAGYGMTLADVTAGTLVAVENQSVLAGGGLVAASSPPNLLTQIGGQGPARFTVRFAPWLAAMSFTRPELLAHPFVTHPAWTATAYDAAGVALGQAGEGLTASYTNVPAQSYTLPGAGIAGVEFDSQGGSLTTFSAALLDDFVLTVATNPLPPAVVLTNPLAGQVFTAPAVIGLGAEAVAAQGAASQVSFYAGSNLLGLAAASPYVFYWSNAAPGAYGLTAVAVDQAGLSRTSPPVAVTVAPAAEQFGILTQPVGATVAVGGGVILSVQTTGTNAVAYQWYQNLNLLPGQTESVLSLAPVSESDGGTYTVTVTSGGEMLTSQGAVLTVLEPPSITSPPLSQQVNMGSDVTLSVGAGGSGPFTYQWTLNGESISGATGSSYTIAAAQPFNSGYYQVNVANAVGLSQSAVAAVTVTVAGGQTLSADDFSNRISINPLVGPVYGNNVNATVEPGEPLPDGKPGGKSIWYTWRASFSGVISLTTRGSSFDTLLAVYTGTNVAELTPVAADDDSGGYFTSLVTFNCVAGTDYQIDVDGFRGASGTVVLGLPAGTGYRVLNPGSGDTVPLITRQPASQLVAAGARAALSVQAASATPLTYQWFFQNAPVAGAGASQLVLSNFQAGAVGNYYVLVANGVGATPSVAASLQLSGPSQGGGTSNMAHDKFGDAVDLSGGGNTPAVARPQAGGGDTGGYSVSQTFSTVGATKEAGEPNACGQAGGASEWYIYTTPAAGTLHADTQGSSFNTILALYTNAGPVVSFANLMEQGCGYTTNYQQQGQPSIALPTAAGVRYYIVVDGYQGASGTARLHIGLGVPPQILSQPQSRPVVPGGSASFSVVAVGTTNFSYQWQFDQANIAGAAASSYTVSNAQTSAAGDYRVIVSNAVGVVTSAPALLNLQSAPFIFGQPANQSVNLGQQARFGVGAGGVAPLHYQWYGNGARLAGATGPSLVLASVKYSNAGAYTVRVSNALGSALSSNALLTVNETTRPTVTVAFPANNYQSAASTLTARGTAWDARAVSYVEVTVNNNAPQIAVGAASWSAGVTLVPYTNRITVRSYNLANLASAPVSLTVVYVLTAPLTLETNGAGAISGPANPARLQIGESYTVTAHPAPGNLLSNWMGGQTLASLAPVGTRLALPFIMSSNLILQANFVTNFFLAAHGAYHGLFAPATPPRAQTDSGSFAFNLTTNGVLSGKLLLGAQTNALSGKFDLSGAAEILSTRPGESDLITILQLDLGGQSVQGTVSDGSFVALLNGDQAVFNTMRPATNYQGRYTLIIPGTNDPTIGPFGAGCGTVTVDASGNITFGGSLADGTTSVSQSSVVSKDGYWPFYVPLYGGAGSLWGTNCFTNHTLIAAPFLSWINPAKAGQTALYRDGFTNEQTAIIGSFYTPTNRPLLNLTNARVILEGGDLPLPITNQITLASNNTITVPHTAGNTNGLTLAITKTNGLISGTFANPANARKTIKLNGVLLQNQTNAAGWFPGANQSGSFLLQP
jgi:hypothetical protein